MEPVRLRREDPERTRRPEMKRIRARLLGIAVVLAVLMSMLVVGPSYAHYSTYCGHGFDGILYYTVYKHAHNIGFQHIHGYGHYRYRQDDGLEYLHHGHRTCV
jgi:hypothetical protein